MYKFSLISLFIFISCQGKSQILVNRSGPTVTAYDQYLKVARNFSGPHYTDTTAANLYKGLDSLGSQITTGSHPILFWIRDLDANSVKTWVLAGTSGAFTTGSVPFAGSLGSLIENNTNFFWDNSLLKLKMKNPSTYTNTIGTWQRGDVMDYKTTGQMINVDMVATTPTLFGQNWGRTGTVYRSKDPNIIKNTSASFFGDSVLAAQTFHWGYGGSSAKYVMAWEIAFADTLGGLQYPFQVYGAGLHANGRFLRNSVVVGSTLDIGFEHSGTQFDGMTGALNVDWNSEPLHFMNVVNYTPSSDAITGKYYPVYDASAKEVKFNPAKALNNYQESEVGYVTTSTNSATGINAVVIGGQGNSVQQQYAFVAGGLNNRDTSIQSAIIAGRTNTTHGTNGFGVGDNIFIGGGLTNRVDCVDCAGIGGDHYVLPTTATGSAYAGGGAGSIAGQNSFMAAQGNDSIYAANMCAIIANNTAGTTVSRINASAHESAIVGGRSHTINGVGDFIGGGNGLTAYSAFETVVGTFNTVYTATSTTAYNSADRAFTVGIGASVGAKADGLIIGKNGKVFFPTTPATGVMADKVLVWNSTAGEIKTVTNELGIPGSFSGVGTATTVFTVTIGVTMANTTYKVLVTPTAALSAALFYVTNKTTTTFDVTYLAGLTGTVSFDWVVHP